MAEVFLGSFPAISRDLGFLPHPVSHPDPLPPPTNRAGLRLQAPFHPACNSFLPPSSLSPEKKNKKKRVRWKTGREIVIFSSQRWTEVTLQLERKLNTASSSLSERTERRGQRKRGVTKVVPCEGWKWSLGKTGIDTLNTAPSYSPCFPSQTTLQSPIVDKMGPIIGVESGLLFFCRSALLYRHFHPLHSLLLTRLRSINLRYHSSQLVHPWVGTKPGEALHMDATSLRSGLPMKCPQLITYIKTILYLYLKCYDTLCLNSS